MSAPTHINLSSLRRRNQGSNNTTSNANVDFTGAKKKKKGLQSDAAYGTSSLNQSANVKDLHQMSADATHSEQKLSEASVQQTAQPIITASGDASFSAVKCLKDEFYDVPCEQLAISLLGKVLVRTLENGCVLKGRIVETECYLGGEDKASHSYRGKMTERNAPMFMKPGTAYVYFTYGMYHCFNISSQGPGAAVLIRAVEPIEGLDVMTDLRTRGVKNKKKTKEEGEEQTTRKKTKPPLRPHELCNGPSKLCIAMDIGRDSCNKRDLASWPGLAVQAPLEDIVGDVEAADGGKQDAAAVVVVVTKRVGIDSAGREWADKPLRFYLLGNTSVSKRDRAKEKEVIAQLAQLAAAAAAS